MFDYSKLLGRIREFGYTQEAIAEAIGIAEGTLSLKFNNKAVFKQTEINAMCLLLKIQDGEIGAYFFKPKVRKNEQTGEA